MIEPGLQNILPRVHNVGENQFFSVSYKNVTFNIYFLKIAQPTNNTKVFFYEKYQLCVQIRF